MNRLVLSLAALGLMSSVAFAGGDAKQGQTQFARCAICHSNTRGAPARIGPNLFGIVNRKAATQPDFSYSSALKNAGLTWTEANLDKWIASPSVMVPGNRMAFAGISSPKDRADLVAYLATLK